MHHSFNTNYRHQPSPFKAPSRSANTYEVASNRSRTTLHDTYDETWPLDDVIDKIDIKSDSEDDLSFYRNTNSWNTGSQFTSDKYDTVYSAFPDSSKPRSSSSRQHDYPRDAQTASPNKWNKPNSYDTNNNYLSDDASSYPWYVDDGSPTLRDVGIQCNLKKYNKVPTKASVEGALVQKPPIKVIKSSTNGFVSAYSDVPKLSSQPKSLESQYCALDFDADAAQHNGAIYSQVNKSGKHRDEATHTNSSNNINIVYKQPLNESISSYRSIHDGRPYDVKSKEMGFSLGHSNAPRISLPNPKLEASYVEPVKVGSYNGSFRNLHDVTPIEKEIIEETISISNASTEEGYPPVEKLAPGRYADNVSFTGNSVTSKASSYRRDSPARLANTHERSNVVKHSPNGTLEKNRDSKSKAKKKGSHKNEENVLLANNSLRLKSSRHPESERLYKSNADLRDQFLRDETRGGLAAAYKNRQHQQQQNRHRALSLSRMNAAMQDDQPGGAALPARHMSQSNLNGTSSRLSDAGSYHRSSRHLQHERDPIVMYIPTVSHQRASGESPKLTGILRNNSTKSTVTLPSKSKKTKESKSQSKTNLKEAAAKEKATAADKKKADLNRRHSMPKDTKFNWFSKFKLGKPSK